MAKEIICICGSTKYKDEIIQVQKELTLQGYVVIGMHLFSQDEGIELSEDQLHMLKEKHKLKIDLSEAIYVINPNGYIGGSTREEIEYALSKGKKIMSLEPLKIPKIDRIYDDHDWMNNKLKPHDICTIYAFILALIALLLVGFFWLFINVLTRYGKRSKSARLHRFF